MADNDYSAWQRRLDLSRKEREPHEHYWSALLKSIAGTRFRKGYKDKGQPVNLENNFARVVMPHLLPRNRKILVQVTPNKPSTPQENYQASAELQSDRVTALLEAIRAAREVRKAIRAWFYSCGILKVGFEVRTGIVEEVPSSQTAGETATVDVDRERVEGKEWLDASLPYLSFVSPWRFLPDPSASALDEARWVAHELFRSIESVRADPDFKPYAEQLQPTHSRLPRAGETSEQAKSADRADPRLGLIQLFEIFDRDTREVLTLGGPGCGVQAVLRTKQWPMGIEGFPFVMLGPDYDWVEGYFWPNPLLAPNGDLAVITDELNKHLIQRVKQAKVVLLYDSDVLKPDEIASIKASQDGDVVPVKGLTQSVKEFSCGQTVADHWNAAQQFQNLWERMTGIGDFQRGVSSPAQDATATEVQALVASSGVRLGDLKSCVAEAINECARMLGTLLVESQGFLGDVVLPLGQGDDRRFVPMGGDAAQVVGEGIDYAYEFSSEPVERTDPAIEQKRTQELIGQSVDPNLGQKLAGEGFALRTAPLVKRLLRLTGEHNPDEYLTPLQPPSAEAEQTAAQEDVEMLQNGQAAPVSPADDHAAHLRVHQDHYQQTQAEPIAQHMAMHEQLMSAEGRTQFGSAGGAGGNGATGASPTAGTGDQTMQRAAIVRQSR